MINKSAYNNVFSSRASILLGNFEKHSKMYMQYITRASQELTTQDAASIGGVDGSASKQANATRSKK